MGGWGGGGVVVGGGGGGGVLVDRVDYVSQNVLEFLMLSCAFIFPKHRNL